MMKTVFLPVLTVGLTAFLAAGCVHFDYEGDEAPETGSPVATVEADTALPAKARVLGRAVVWGDYRDISRDRLTERLQSEAAERGANTVRITAEQVVPGGTSVRIDPTVKTLETTTSDNANAMNQLQRDFDGGYGQAELFGKNARPEARNATAGARDYTRIIRAEFLVCDPPISTVKRKSAAAKTAEAKPVSAAAKTAEAKPVSAAAKTAEAKPVSAAAKTAEAKPVSAAAKVPAAKPAAAESDPPAKK